MFNIFKYFSNKSEQSVAEPPVRSLASFAPVMMSRKPTAGVTISIMNLSTILTDAEVQAAIVAAQIQIDRDFGYLWGISANLAFVPKTKLPAVGSWVIQILDTSDLAGALGYHSLTNADRPCGKIFVKDDQKYGLSWTVTLTHEIMEMLGDPMVDLTVFAQDSNTTGTLYAYEMCDACEDDSMGYLINGILVSDFVLPAYFQAGVKAPKYDFKGHLTAPLSIGKGGYMSVFPVNPTTAGWSQATGAEGIGTRLASKSAASRTQRRANPFK